MCLTISYLEKENNEEKSLLVSKKMIAKNERLKQQNIDKIAIFLNKKYNKVFKDKEFTMDNLKFEI